MKKSVTIVCLIFLTAAVQAKGVRDDVNFTGEKARASYAFGMTIGGDLKQSGMEMDYTAFTEGLKAAMEHGMTIMDRDEALEIVQNAFESAMSKRSEELRIQEALFLTENAARDGVSSTESGLQYEVIEEGSGPKPAADDTVRVHYEGTLTDGTVFDSSYQREEPQEFPLDMVIPGWAEGIQLMNVGSKYRIYIPSAIAYGENGGGQIIPPYSPLIFTVELLEILEKNEEAEETTPSDTPVEAEVVDTPAAES